MLNVHDIELIESWTPRQYNNFIKGAQHRRIDEYEYAARSAMMQRKAQNEKKLRETDLFNAERARKNIDNNQSEEERIKKMVELNKQIKGFQPDFRPKGG